MALSIEMRCAGVIGGCPGSCRVTAVAMFTKGCGSRVDGSVRSEPSAPS
jgi:hypothetical protein